MGEFLKEFFAFLKNEKKWWLAPLVVVLVLAVAFLALTQSGAQAPLFYPRQ
ncbi:MAG: hypothetical protein HY303_15280 [Candidatus Wallbacteria bacterium]|nr:hypothetical protein [Candidatus Wallbacteria bacterium]